MQGHVRAAFVVLQRKQLHELIPALKQRVPDSLRLCYLAQNVLAGSWQGVDFITDTWPDFSTVIARPAFNGSSAKFCKFSSNEYEVYSSDTQKLSNLLCSPQLINWKENIKFQAFPVKHLEALKSSCSSDGTLTEDAAFTMYTGDATVSSHIERTLEGKPEKWRFTSMSETDAEFVDKHWQRSTGQDSVDYLQKILQTFPSVCLRNQLGEMIAHYVTYHTGSLGIGYTTPEFRNRGMSRLAVAFLARRTLENGRLPFGYVANHDTTANQLMVGSGLVRNQGCDVVWCKFSQNS